MLYQGSKAKIGKVLAPIIEYYRPKRGTITEPFCGGLNMTQYLPGDKYCSDANKYLIAMWKKILYDKWDPPKEWNEEHYEDVRDNKNNYPDHYVGYIGFCSFGGAFFNGFRHPDKYRPNYPLEYYKNILEQQTRLYNIHLSCSSYTQISINANTVIYCDPPYEQTKKYSVMFNSHLFWDWCRKVSTSIPVLISEYNAPLDFRMIWFQERKSGMRTGNATAHLEKLFIHESYFTKLFL